VRVSEAEIRITEKQRHPFYMGEARPLGEEYTDPEPCEVILKIRGTVAECMTLFQMRGQDINPPTRAAAPKDRQLPEQGEPEVVACVVEQPKALPPRRKK
jgi:hypothetical protein